MSSRDHLARQLRRSWLATRRFLSSQPRPRSAGPPPNPHGYAPFASPPRVFTPPTPEEAAALRRRNALTASVLAAAAGAGYYQVFSKKKDAEKEAQASLGSSDGLSSSEGDVHHLVNWSGTHECEVSRFYQPESLEELEAVVAEAHAAKKKLRCIGSGLSPNGLSFEGRGMVSLALMDRILEIDAGKGRVRVQAGARVQAVADALRPHGLTLLNYASIREQTVGGLTQVSGHGTGARIPPVDDSVVGLKLVTPAAGTVDLSFSTDPELFSLARVGLGCLGVAAEVTLQCVPAHKLVERTFVASPAEVRAQHDGWLRGNKHLRYMWLPYTDAVVVVQCNPLADEEAIRKAEAEAAASAAKAAATKPMLELAAQRKVALPSDVPAESLSAPQLRDLLLTVAPMDPSWVAKVNAAEAEVWRASSGVRVGWSDEILGFECGGQQWVLEVAFPTGTVESPSDADLRYMQDLLELIKRHKVPAPAPIEQRWTAGSASRMSPSHGEPGSIHSWVGIIMYLGTTLEERATVTAAFRKYARLVEEELMPQYNAVEHWAKIEVPEGERELQAAQKRLAERYPVAAFAAARARLDPYNVLGNDMMDTLLGLEKAERK